MRVSVLWIACCFPGLAAGAPADLPGCEMRPEVRNVLEEKLNWKELQKLKYTEQMARRREVLGELIAKYPREAGPHRRLIQDTRWMDPDQFPALQERYRKQAAQNPEDPLALYLAGLALYQTDTAESIRLLEKAKRPDFGWPALQLASIYAGGKRMDKKKASENIAAFFSTCPHSTDGTAQWQLSKAGDAALQARVAAALRAHLAQQTDPKRLKDYETLWGLEFRTRPPQQHDALRKQVAEDLKRLESLNSKPDAEWLAFLKNGYKQSGAPKATLDAMDERLQREFPASQEAYGIARERWRKEHKEPEGHKDAAAWAKYNAEYKTALQGWIRDYPEVRYLGPSWFYAISDDDALPEAEGLAAMERYLTATTVDERPSPWNYAQAAQFLVQHKWQAQRALALLKSAERLFAEERERERRNDNLSTEDLEDREKGEVYEQQNTAGLVLKAAKMASQPEAAGTMTTSIEGPAPKDKKQESGYWLNRARLAALEQRKADALTYYQRALQTRLAPARHRRGKLQDDLTDEARALWKEMGGTEVAWEVWSKPAVKAQELAEGRWEKAKKQLPAFELADLSGQTWRLKNLEGKSVLINLWATWCGPCQAELPHLQKLYEKMKGRTDVQVLTFNIDEDLGLVAPWVREKGYTFPVLPAFSFVMGLLDGVGIPQNWIVDPKGTWRWTQLGFDASDAEWMEGMVKRLESIRGGE